MSTTNITIPICSIPHQQIFSALSPHTPHQTFPFPYSFGQQTAHRCWVQTGLPTDSLTRINFRQYFWHTTWNQTTSSWTKNKSTISADLIFLYKTNNPNDPNSNLPQTLAIDFNNLTQQTAQQFYNNLIQHPHPLYFDPIQRTIFLHALGHIDQSPANLPNLQALYPSLWSSPTDPTALFDYTRASNNPHLLHLCYQFLYHHRPPTPKEPKQPQEPKSAQQPKEPKEPKQPKPPKPSKQPPPPRQPKSEQDKQANLLRQIFFRLYTKSHLPLTTKNKQGDSQGWPTPKIAITHELTLLDAAGRSRPETIARWAKWELVYTYPNNPSALEGHSAFVPSELTYLNLLLDQAKQIINSPTFNSRNPLPA